VLPGTRNHQRHYLKELADFLLHEQNPERALDAIELSFRVVDRSTRRFEYLKRAHASESADAAIEELNARFREHGVGYAFNNGEIIRIDSQSLHAEAVRPEGHEI
jgi:AbiJ N-terminal domain 4